MAAEGSGAGASGSSAASDVEKMMAELGLREEDLDDVVFDEKDAPPEATRWMAVARVHIDKPYSQAWFFKNMRAAWDLAHDVKFRPLEDNLYTLQLFCLGDWERVMQEGPWNFRGNAVVIAPYDGVTKPSLVKLDTIDIWIQIHDVPDKYAHLVPALAAKVGEVLFAEPITQDFAGNFYRVWIRINVYKPLKNAVSMIRDLKHQICKVKYERLPDWCAVCGHLGHVYKEHGDGIHAPSALYFKDLKATWNMRVGSGPGGGRGHGRRGRRGGGRSDGRGGGNNSQPGEEPHEDHDADAVMGDADANRKRSTAHGNVDGALMGVETGNNVALTAQVPPSPPPKQDPKRARTNAEKNSEKSGGKKGTVQDNKSEAKSVTSRVEDRRAQ